MSDGAIWKMHFQIENLFCLILANYGALFGVKVVLRHKHVHDVHDVHDVHLERSWSPW